MNEIIETTCPNCGKKVKFIRYGYHWVGVCCEKIFYDSPELPQNVPEEIKDEGQTEGDGEIRPRM